MLKLSLCLFTLTLICFDISAHEAPSIQLATKYQLQHNIHNYWVSEKLDGVRGYWTGSELLTKNGNLINTPKWFTLNWPKQAIDGELWIDRNKFEQTISCIKRKIATQCWHNVRFMMFDLPQSKLTFTNRIKEINLIIKQVKSPYLNAIQQFKLSTIDELNNKLKQVVKSHGEGLMLHYENAIYSVGRTRNILKLKPYQDAEAVVLQHIEGKGKYKGILGSIQVITPEGIIFKIGSGFSDQERKSPPPVGSTITFKYIGKTQKGVPKFASFIGIRGKKF